MLLLLSLVSVVVSAALGLATNAASSSTGPWPWGLGVVQRYPWQVAAVLIVGAVLLAMLILRLTWRAEDEALRAASASPEALNAVAESLAVALRDEIDDELRTRGLGMWIDLPVRVDPGGPTTLDAVLTGLARSSRRVVVTGAAGSGKSTALMMAARQLLRERDDRRAVPVLVNLSTWDPVEERLDDAIRRRLGLPRRRRRGPEPIDVVSTRRVVPVLDGVDELPEALWPAARTALARSLDSSDREFVLACTSEAMQAIVPDECLHVGGTRVVTLISVGVEGSIAYLKSASRDATRRWDPVFDRLRDEPDGVLARALSSPLLLHLALVVYRDRDSDPAELADDATFASVGHIERHLLSHYLASAYGGVAVRAHRWLRSIAALLTSRRSTEFVWWHAGLPTPFALSPPRAPRRSAGSGAWRLAFAKFGAVSQAVFTGACAVVWAHVTMTRHALELNGTPVDLAEVMRFQNWWVIGSLSVAALVLVLTWIRVRAPGPEAESGLRAQLAADRRAATVRGGYLAAVLGACATAAVVVGWPYIADKARILLTDEELRRAEFMLDVPDTPRLWLLGVSVGAGTAVVVLAAVLWGTAWFRFRVACLTSAVLGRTPWRLVGFLEDAHERGVLRRNGATFQFRHRTVQWYLARPLPPQPVRQVIAEAEQALAEAEEHGSAAAVRRLGTAALYDRTARAAWNHLSDDHESSAARPRVLSIRRALAWWEAVIDSGANDAVEELSDLYDWLIEVHPPGPVRYYLTLRADSFEERHQGTSDEVYTITLTETVEVAPAVESALRLAASWSDDPLSTGAVLAALAQEDLDIDWTGLWDHLDHPDLDHLADAEDPEGAVPLVLDHDSLTLEVSELLAEAITLAARTAERYATSPVSGGLLLLALLTLPRAGARETLLAHSDLDTAALVDEALNHLGTPEQFSDYADWASTSLQNHP